MKTAQQTRDFTFIDDVVDATLVVGTHPRAEGEVFNVGTGAETSVIDLARAIASTLGVQIRRSSTSTAVTSTTSGGAWVNVEKIRRMLRWSPQYVLESGLRRMAQVLVSMTAEGIDLVTPVRQANVAVVLNASDHDHFAVSSEAPCRGVPAVGRPDVPGRPRHRREARRVAHARERRRGGVRVQRVVSAAAQRAAAERPSRSCGPRTGRPATSSWSAASVP